MSLRNASDSVLISIYKEAIKIKEIEPVFIKYLEEEFERRKLELPKHKK
ncbi:sporulation histidine kinase inhibitor Sda [Paenibacillus glucanolyticus]